MDHLCSTTLNSDARVVFRLERVETRIAVESAIEASKADKTKWALSGPVKSPWYPNIVKRQNSEGGHGEDRET